MREVGRWLISASSAGAAFGLGPVLSYVQKLGNVNSVAEVKWLPELTAEHRLKGDIGWLKVPVNVPF
jgi:hypothetical protein